MMSHSDAFSFDLQVILPKLVSMDVMAPRGLLAGIVSLLSDELHTDRVSCAVVDETNNQILGIEHVGGNTSLEEETVAGKVIVKAMTEGKPQVFGNMRDIPDLASVRADEYKTNGCAVIPLCYRGNMIGAICLSNLTTTQVMGMLVQKRELELFMSITSMLAIVHMLQVAGRGIEQFKDLLERLESTTAEDVTD